jgi:mannose-6-phosphate isomerase
LISARRLAPVPHKRIWGSPLTEPWYPNPEGVTRGEIWFTPSNGLPLLVKFLFTSDKLSIQVHPDDKYAREHGHPRGKTEMWHILRAAADAKVALGVREAVTKTGLAEAAICGTIEQLLNWTTVSAGDTFLIEAGTVHAIGAGIVLCEVQELSDLTYRLYDYGRLGDDGKPRELHIEEGIAVARVEPGECAVKGQPLSGGRELLAESPWFRTEKLSVAGTSDVPAPAKTTLFVALEGEGLFAGEKFAAGDVWEISAAGDGFEISSPRASFLVASEP